MPGLFHAGGASTPASFAVPLEPLEPLDPLDPEEPLDPDVPLDPEEPLVPLEPLLPGVGLVAAVDVSVIANRSDDPAPLHAATTERTLDARTTAATRDFMTAELYRPEQRCPTPMTHGSDSLTSPIGDLRAIVTWLEKPRAIRM